MVKKKAVIGNTVWSQTGKCVSCHCQGAILGSRFPNQIFSPPPLPVLGKNAGNTHHFKLYLNTLLMLRSLSKISRWSLTLYKQLFRKKCRSYHSKNVVLGLEKPLFGEKSAREAFIECLKYRFLSDKTLIFFKKAVHNGLNYICEFFGKDLSIISVFK